MRMQFPFLVLSLLSLLILGCGKKVDEEKALLPRVVSPDLTDIDLELSKQEILCGADRICPSYLAKIAVNKKNSLSFCTGFLIDDDVLVTSSSCLPDRLRFKDMPCATDLFFFFAQENGKPLRVGCSKVLEVSGLSSKEPYLWRSNVAYLKMNASVKFRKLVPTRLGMNDGDAFYIWSVDQIDNYQGIIRKAENCKSVHNTYFNPLSVTASSPVMTVAGCDYNEGNSGAPVLDYRGRVRGIVSRPIDQADIDVVTSMRILEKPLRPMIYVTNYACAPLYPDQDILNESECNRKLDISSYDLAKKELINESKLFKPAIQKVEMSVNEKNRYLTLAVKLSPVDEAYEVQVYPKCFKNASKWVHEFGNKPFTFSIDVPVLKIKKSMSEFGQISSLEYSRAVRLTNFQFRPSVLRTDQNATVFMWSDGATTNFPNLPAACESLL